MLAYICPLCYSTWKVSPYPKDGWIGSACPPCAARRAAEMHARLVHTFGGLSCTDADEAKMGGGGGGREIRSITGCGGGRRIIRKGEIFS